MLCIQLSSGRCCDGERKLPFGAMLLLSPVARQVSWKSRPQTEEEVQCQCGSHFPITTFVHVCLYWICFFVDYNLTLNMRFGILTLFMLACEEQPAFEENTHSRLRALVLSHAQSTHPPPELRTHFLQDANEVLDDWEPAATDLLYAGDILEQYKQEASHLD